MERISQQVIATEDLTAEDVNAVTFNIPASLARWAIHVVPRHDDAGTSPTVDVAIQYWDGEEFRTPVPAAALSAVGKTGIGIIDNGAIVSRIQVSITNGAIVMDGGIEINLLGVRQN